MRHCFNTCMLSLFGLHTRTTAGKAVEKDGHMFAERKNKKKNKKKQDAQTDLGSSTQEAQDCVSNVKPLHASQVEN